MTSFSPCTGRRSACILEQLLSPGGCLTTAAVLILIIVLLAGCSAPSLPHQNHTYSPTELKYILLDHYNESLFFYCDPDSYPVSQGNELEKAVAAFPVIHNNTGEFNAIIVRKGLVPPFTNDSKLIIYREYKKLNALHLAPATEDTDAFGLNLQEPAGGVQVTGIVRNDGVILEQNMEPAILTCPVCLAGGTPIDTPHGPVPVEELRAGMIVWTRNSDRSWLPVPVLRTMVTPVGCGHRMVHLTLSDGREVTASPVHPTADGRILGVLQPGDDLDGALVTGAGWIVYSDENTYDILPAGDTGFYRAGGILMKSTLA